MSSRFFLKAFVGIASAALFAGNAAAGDWLSGCNFCGHTAYPTGQVYYAQPTYSYAQPTITVIPHYVVQPNYIVQRTYVVPQTRYLYESAPCPINCDQSYMVNQGQYQTESTLVAPPTTYETYSPGYYPPRHRRHIIDPRRRNYGVSSYRVNRFSTNRTNYRRHYQ